jgi:hypothetical protein
MWTSRLRLSDFGRLLLLKRPVRCHTCLRRDYVSYAVARRMRQVEMTLPGGAGGRGIDHG